jgi:hypothetical protein
MSGRDGGCRCQCRRQNRRHLAETAAAAGVAVMETRAEVRWLLTLLLQTLALRLLLLASATHQPGSRCCCCHPWGTASKRDPELEKWTEGLGRRK